MVDQLLVGKAFQSQVVDARAEVRQFLLALGHQHGAVALEAAIVADQFLDVLPDRHRGDRQRNLGNVASKLAHAPGVDA